MQDHYPVYLPSKSLLSEKLLFHAHLKTIHSGVNKYYNDDKQRKLDIRTETTNKEINY